MNYEQYLQGQSDFHLCKPRQSVNSDYIRGYSDEVALWLSAGNTVCYDVDVNTFTPHDNTLFVTAQVVEKITANVWRVENINFRHPKEVSKSNRLSLEEYLKQPHSDLVHVTQIVQIRY
jgi:hypothetical protein